MPGASAPRLSDAEALGDGRPALEKCYIAAAIAWREPATESVTVRMLGEELSPFRRSRPASDRGAAAMARISLDPARFRLARNPDSP